MNIDEVSIKNIVFSIDAPKLFGRFLEERFPYAHISFFASLGAGTLAKRYLDVLKTTGLRVDLVGVGLKGLGSLGDLGKIIPHIHEDTRVLVAFGEIELIKALKLAAKIRKLPLVVVPTQAMTSEVLLGRVYIEDGGIMRLLECASPSAVFCDEKLLAHIKEHLLIDATADLVSQVLTLFDNELSFYINDLIFKLRAEHEEIVEVALLSVRLLGGAMRGDKAVRVELLTQLMLGAYLVSVLGETGSSARVVAMLKQVKGSVKDKGLVKLACSGLLTKLYRLYLTWPYSERMCDISLRCTFLHTYFNETYVHKMAKDICKTQELVAILHKYSQPLIEKLEKVQMVLEVAGELVSLANRTITQDEFSMSFALSAELATESCMLTALRNVGLLDFPLSKGLDRLSLAMGTRSKSGVA